MSNPETPKQNDSLPSKPLAKPEKLMADIEAAHAIDVQRVLVTSQQDRADLKNSITPEVVEPALDLSDFAANESEARKIADGTDGRKKFESSQETRDKADESIQKVEQLQRTPLTRENVSQYGNDLQTARELAKQAGVELDEAKFTHTKLKPGSNGAEFDSTPEHDSKSGFTVNMKTGSLVEVSDDFDRNAYLRHFLADCFHGLGEHEKIVFGSKADTLAKLNEVVLAGLGVSSPEVFDIRSNRAVMLLGASGVAIPVLQARGAFQPEGGINEDWFKEFAMLNRETILSGSTSFDPKKIRWPGDSDQPNPAVAGSSTVAQKEIEKPKQPWMAKDIETFVKPT